MFVRSASESVSATRGGPACSAEYSAERRDDHVREVAFAAHVQRQRSQLVEGDQDLDSGVGGNVEELARRVDRIDVDDDRPEPERRKGREDVLRAVRQHDADAVALGNSKGHEGLCQPIGAALDFAKRERRTEKRRGLRIRRLDRRRGENLVQRLPGIGHPCRHPIVVVLQPRARGVRGRRAGNSAAPILKRSIWFET